VSKDVDNNYLSISDADGVHLENVTLPTGDEDSLIYDDVLKFSHATNCSFVGGTVYGGRENCIDMNRECENVLIEDTLLIGGATASVVIKGGSRNCTLSEVLITPGGGRWDIELGGHSDQSRKRTVNTRLFHVRRTDGRPVRVVVGRADKPEIRGGYVEVLFWESLALKLFVFFRGLFSK